MKKQLENGGIPPQPFEVGGTFHFQQVRDGKVIDEWEDKNLVVDEGLNHLLQTVLGGGAANATWYVGLFEGNYTPVAGIAAAGFAAAATECIAYDEATRQTWVEAAAAAKQITNSANKATFTMNNTKTIYGAFLISDSAKNGVAGVLFAASRFSASRAVVDNDQLLVTYTVQAASS